MKSRIYQNFAMISTLSLDAESNRFMEMGKLIALSSISFGIPFLFTNQLTTGIMVNMSLIGGALYLRGRNLIPLVMLPSIAALSRGIIFGSLTYYLLLMIPFIWIGNAALVLSIKLIHLKMKKNYLSAAIAGSIIKFLLLALFAVALYSLGLIPKELLFAMGIMQLITAASASMAMFPFKVIYERVRH